eukprot:TRINITY_DN10797_c0_g1_i6.p1 TRINITY_DN10797_c0_g1~~TRINITY_DN10797_c0_g1_i6.p1  ORF type:complete len:587 (-),score=194.28 TRINITY_DN10797_c0_g1_i6:100-1860(-)
MSWGVELWDCVEEVLGQVTSDTEDVCGVYGKFIKERGEVEREYAKNLRKLCGKYLPRKEKSGRGQQEEMSKERAFRLLLTELGYQAGQHEQLSEIYTKTIPQDLKTKAKEDSKLAEKYKKEIKHLQQSIDQAQKSLEKSSLKYKKSHQDWVVAEETLQKGESDCSLSRREVEKLRCISCEKQKMCEESKSLHARQMTTVKERKEEYLQTSLPAALNGLQGLSVGSGQYMKEVWLRCVRAEQEADKVIQGCHKEMERIAEEVRPEEDAKMVIETFKTGNMPFTEVTEAKTNTIKRSKSSMKISNDIESQTLYQQKRQLQTKIESLEVEISKGQKEMTGLQLMVQSYTSNPQFGDVTKFKAELDRATLKVQLHESDLDLLNKELSGVNTRLEGMRRSSSFSQPTIAPQSLLDRSGVMRRDRSPEGSVASCTQSDSSGYPSTASIGSASDKDNDSIEESSDYKRRIQTLLSQSEALYLPSTRGSTSSYVVEDVECDFEGEEEYLPPPPDDFLEDPPLSHPLEENIHLSQVVALYAFDVCTEGNIPMVEGEQFYEVLEDQGGWTRVRRVDGRFFQDEGEGFVPTSFIRKL